METNQQAKKKPLSIWGAILFFLSSLYVLLIVTLSWIVAGLGDPILDDPNSMLLKQQDMQNQTIALGLTLVITFISLLVLILWVLKLRQTRLLVLVFFTLLVVGFAVYAFTQLFDAAKLINRLMLVLPIVLLWGINLLLYLTPRKTVAQTT